jgi:branched-chain amino acid transport system ATP-binding protein
MLTIEGRIFISGKEASLTEPEERLGWGLCLVPERRELFGSMSVEDSRKLLPT